MLFSGAANNQGMKADALRAARRRSALSRGNVMGLRAGSTCLKCLLLLAIVLAGGVPAQAGNYPDKPVRLILDAAAGGSNGNRPDVCEQDHARGAGHPLNLAIS